MSVEPGQLRRESYRDWPRSASAERSASGLIGVWKLSPVSVDPTRRLPVSRMALEGRT